MVASRISSTSLFSFFRRNFLRNKNELKTWRLAAFFLVLIAASVFFIQRFIGQVFDIAFEVCIFYIPAFAIVVLFLYFRSKP